MPADIAVFAADLHLDRNAWLKKPDLFGDSYCSLQQIIHNCLYRGLPAMLGGDLWDKTRPNPEAVAVMCRQMDLMQAAALPVFYVQGQHELDRVTPWLSVHSWPTHVHEKAFMIGSHKAWGLDWLPRGQLQEALDRIPADTEILMCHQVWEEFMGIGNTDGSFEEIPHARLVLTGDYHKYLLTSATGKTGQRIQVCSPGSTCMQSLDEPPNKWYLRIQDGLGAEAVGLLVRGFATYQLLLPDEFERDVAAIASTLDVKSIQQIPDEIAKPALRIRYSDSIPEAYQRLRTAIGDRAHLFLEPIATTSETTVDYEAGANVGAFDDMISTIQTLTTDQQVLTSAGRLWSAENVTAAIDELFKEFMAMEDA